MGEEGKQRLFLCSDGGGGGAGPDHWPTLLCNVLMLQRGKICATVSVNLPFIAALFQQVTSEKKEVACAGIVSSTCSNNSNIW